MAKQKKAEVRYEIKTLEVHKKCPECRKGHMISTGKIKFGDRLMFWHKCDNCGFRETYSNTYPYTEYRYEEITE